VSAALVTTCYQEAEAIGPFLEAVAAQTRQPDEVIIVDAGSNDGTLEQIQERIGHGAEIRLIVEPGANRAVGRNLGVKSSAAQLIGVTDVGANPRPDWFEKIIAPLEQSDEVDVVSGYYAPDPHTLWETAVAAATVPAPEEVEPASFLPSSRSVAFRRGAWERAGGYPEWARYNEDTPFDFALRKAGARFAFEAEAIVEWRPQGSVRRLFMQFYRYACGDAQSRLWFRHYAKAYAMAGLSLGLCAAGGVWPPALWGLAGLGVGYWGRHAARARRRTSSVPAAVVAPLANVIVDVAHVVGYTRGIVERVPHETGEH